jgi:hypothetical protein
MEHCPSDALGTTAAAWFLAAAAANDGDPTESEDGTPPNVIIAVSLDELDGLSGDMLV